MRVRLTVTDGPHRGQVFSFEGHEAVLAGRRDDAKIQLDHDPYFSRSQFLLEVNAPACRLVNLSKQGTVVNNRTVTGAIDVNDGDEIFAGQTRLLVEVHDPASGATPPPPASSRPPSSPPPPPPNIPGYAIVGPLGKGGTGVVYKATRQADGKVVAVKVIHPAQPSAVATERFLREARILQQLSHPNIISFHDIGDLSGSLWFAMDLVDGPDLGALVKQVGAMSPGRAVRLGLQLLDALDHAHEKGFVHRDIKPSNLMLDGGSASDVLKVTDFGLARTYQASPLSGLTVAGLPGGTPLFMPPEQMLDFRNAKPAADQYGAAATLYYLMSARHIYDPADTMFGMFLKIRDEEPVSLTTRRTEVPLGLAAAIHRALARKQEERFPDVRAFAAALRPFAAG